MTSSPADQLLIRSTVPGENGIVAQVSAQQAGWDLLNMTVRRMAAGESWSGNTGQHEFVHVILGGKCHIHTSAGDYLDLGRRPDVFSGMPYALYLSRDTDFTVDALTDNFELATCWVPSDEDHPAQLITPADSKVDLRGGGNASRQVNSIIPPGFDCQHIVCVEAYVPGGNWAGYPPHKHDQHVEDDAGNVLEADLEEIYFYKLNPSAGYAYQRIYTDDRSLDTVIMAEDNDTILIPEGYHPTVTAHGYTTYLLNFLAGSAQSLANSDDPAHVWVKDAWGPLDPRLPIVDHSMEPSDDG
jgi:5-deoxy-glucuronate isomerase